MRFAEIEDLEVFVYWLYLRDAVIFNYAKTASGIEYLEKCYRMDQTEPDRNALRDKFGKG